MSRHRHVYPKGTQIIVTTTKDGKIVLTINSPSKAKEESRTAK